MSFDHLYLLDDPSSSNVWCPPGSVVDDDDDDTLLYLSQPFYPSPEPSLDFLRPLSSDPSPPKFPSPPSQQLHSLSIEPSETDVEAMTSTPRTMQRSLSSQTLDQKNKKTKQHLKNPPFFSPSETHRLGLGGVMRRACSTGDLKKTTVNTSLLVGKEGDRVGDGSPMVPSEEGAVSPGSFTVGRYSSEERRHRIERYRNKRNQRNFSKSIKYACRKTLAEGRPRVRGRFARNDEMGEAP